MTKRLSYSQINRSTSQWTRGYLRLISFFLLVIPSFASNAQTSVPVIKEGHFTIQITIFGKRISGLLIAKKVDTLTHRMVMVSETGFQLFDLAITDDSTLIKQCIEPLQKKKLIELIKTDLRYLVNTQLAAKISKKAINEHESCWKIAPTKRFKIKYHVEKNDANIASKISIKHIALPLRYQLIRIEKIVE